MASEGAHRKLSSEDPEASDVIRFLRDNVGWYYCDECLSIESKAGTPVQVSRIMRDLVNIRDVYDQQGKCDTCGKIRGRSLFFLVCSDCCRADHY
jgi:hypothetical protein